MSAKTIIDIILSKVTYSIDIFTLHSDYSLKLLCSRSILVGAAIVPLPNPSPPLLVPMGQ